MSERQYDLGTRYEFETVLGRGGMGVVLRAKDNVLNRPVAIKLLSDELAHIPEAQEIFLTEGRAMASLKHPNMVSVFDVVDTGSKAMMVFEFVDGENFDDLRRAQGKIDPDMVVSSAIQLCEALAYLHENGFIHRDLKPANVMVQADGDVKLIDFGLARSLEVIAERGTRVRGSPAYMSPEQFTGDGLSASSDIYALGVTLFELLSGEVPFLEGDKAFAHVHRAPPKLAEKIGGLHPLLYRLVDQCLEKKPADRPKSAREVIRILSEIEGQGATKFETSTLLDIAPSTHDAEAEAEAEPEPVKASGSPVGKYLGLVALVLGLAGIGLAVSRDSEVADPVVVEEAPVEVAEVPPPTKEVVVEPDIVGPVKGILGLAVVISENATEQFPLVDELPKPRIQINAQIEAAPKISKKSRPTTEPSTLAKPPVDPPEIAEPATSVVVAEPEPKAPEPVFEPIAVVKPAQATSKAEKKIEPKTKTKTVPKKEPPKEEKPAEVPWSF